LDITYLPGVDCDVALVAVVLVGPLRTALGIYLASHFANLADLPIPFLMHAGSITNAQTVFKCCIAEKEPQRNSDSSAIYVMRNHSKSRI